MAKVQNLDKYCWQLHIETGFHLHTCLLLYHSYWNWQHVSAKNTRIINRLIINIENIHTVGYSNYKSVFSWNILSIPAWVIQYQTAVKMVTCHHTQHSTKQDAIHRKKYYLQLVQFSTKSLEKQWHGITLRSKHVLTVIWMHNTLWNISSMVPSALHSWQKRWHCPFYFYHTIFTKSTKKIIIYVRTPIYQK